MVVWLGYVWCVLSFLAPHIPCFTHIVFVLLAPTPQEQNTQSDRTSISFHVHRGHPSRTRDVSHLPWMCSCHLSSREAWVFSLTSMPVTFTVRPLSSSLVSVGGFVCERSVPYRERPSSRVTHTLGCSSESVPASTDQQLNTHLTRPTTAQPVTDDTLASFLPPTTSLIHPNLPMCLHPRLLLAPPLHHPFVLSPTSVPSTCPTPSCST